MTLILGRGKLLNKEGGESVERQKSNSKYTIKIQLPIIHYVTYSMVSHDAIFQVVSQYCNDG